MKSKIGRLSNALRSGEITSAELTEKYIAEIEKQNGKLNAYVLTTFDEARAAAKRADERIAKGEGGVLCGVPMTLKDNISTKGIATTCCSKILEGYVPFYDATVWEKLRDEGAVLLGKTNMDEFAMGSTSETSVHGAPKNPRNTDRVTGGSSGGGAAAVTADIAAYAIGSDTGGSIRQPASFCGAVGFKPSYGTVSRYGLIAYGSSLDQIGPICSSVSDCAILYDAMKGEDSRDMTSCPISTEKTNLDIDLKGLTIGMPEEFFDGLNLDIASCIENAAKAYEKLGATVKKISVPSLKKALPAYYIIACAEASSNLGRYDGIRYGYRAKNYSSVDDMVVKTRSEGFGKEVQKRIMLGTYVLSSGYYDAYYKKACLLRDRVTSEMTEVFRDCDVLFAPTAPTVAFPLGYAGGNPIETYLSDVCTVPVNIAGLPAISLPCGEAAGLPVGLQIIGNRFEDEKVLAAAYAAEKNDLFDIPEVEGGVRL